MALASGLVPGLAISVEQKSFIEFCLRVAEPQFLAPKFPSWHSFDGFTIVKKISPSKKEPFPRYFDDKVIWNALWKFCFFSAAQYYITCPIETLTCSIFLILGVYREWRWTFDNVPVGLCSSEKGAIFQPPYSWDYTMPRISLLGLWHHNQGDIF